MCELDNCLANRPPASVISQKERRLFMAGVVALPLATILADAGLAHAQAKRGETISQTLADGREIEGYLARNDNPNAPVVVLIHEWWGLNDQIKAMAVEVSQHGFHALAIDLFAGSVATDRAGALAQIGAMDADEAKATIAHWLAWARANGNGNGKVATLGWCFGGGWSLQSALLDQNLDAAIIYYGRVDVTPQDLATLNTPLLGHFATQDASINAAMVEGFEANLKRAGKADLLTRYWYDAGHGFANPSGGRYDREDTQLAWQRTHAFLREHLL